MKRLFFGGMMIFFLSGSVWAQDETAAKVEVLTKTSTCWDGRALPDYSVGKPEITILKITIPPKAQLPLHKHPVINAGVLVKGALTVVTAAGETLYLKAGDPIVEVVEKWHYGKNEGEAPAEIIVFYAGIKDSPITVKETDKDTGK